MRKTALDKAILSLFPGWGFERMRHRHNAAALASLSPGYQGGQSTRRRTDIRISTEREDTAAGSDYAEQIAAAMNLYRNDPMTGSIVDTVATYMGESRPTATTSDKDFNDEATEYFNSYW